MKAGRAGTTRNRRGRRSRRSRRMKMMTISCHGHEYIAILTKISMISQSTSLCPRHEEERDN